MKEIKNDIPAITEECRENLQTLLFLAGYKNSKEYEELCSDFYVDKMMIILRIRQKINTLKILYFP